MTELPFVLLHILVLVCILADPVLDTKGRSSMTFCILIQPSCAGELLCCLACLQTLPLLHLLCKPAEQAHWPILCISLLTGFRAVDMSQSGMPAETAVQSCMYGITTAGFESPAWLMQSGIHGWGLIARAEMKQDSMVVEYRGDLLRPKMSDDRQKLYNRIGKDCYLFNVNDDVVIDATMTGAVGRFTVRLSSSAQPQTPAILCKSDTSDCH